MNGQQQLMIHNLLHNLHPQSTSGTEEQKQAYAKGILVAVVGMLQAYETKFDFDRAFMFVALNSPDKIIVNAIPECWKTSLVF